MARTWLAIRVELLGGRGQEFWPPPGRVMAVGPSHTFADFAEAVDTALGRWDRAHLCQFVLADGRTITDKETAGELADSPWTPIGSSALHLDRAKVASVVSLGAEFSYVFDFGDDWMHRCVVEDAKIDPLETLGITPRRPLPFWGWGDLPDQYGRLYPEPPDGPKPVRPARPHPMLTGEWPARAPDPPVDMRDLRGAIVRRDADALLAAIAGRDVDDVLQHVGGACLWLLAQDRERGEVLAGSLVNRLALREWVGDEVLLEELVAELRRTPLARRRVPVDLADLADGLSGNEFEDEPGYLNLVTGDVIPAFLTDESLAEDNYVDVEEEPDRWLALERHGSRVGWSDMAAFAEALPPGATRNRLETAIHGKGAFRRFRDAIEAEDLVDHWRRHSDDRALGRSRQFLADHGLRAD